MARQVGGYSHGKATLLFDVATFEPTAYVSDITLPAAPVALEGSWFVVLVNRVKRLYDPLHDRFSDVPNDLLQVHPDGRRAYVLGDDCSLQEWQIDPAKKLRTLARSAHFQGGCDVHGFDDAAVTANGALLVTRQGVWNLTTGKRLPLPNRSPKDSYQPAIAGRGKYLLRLRSVAGPADGMPTSRVDLYDLETGAVRTSSSLSTISNGDPFVVRSDPDRVCVFDYGITVLLIPSLQELDTDALPRKRSAPAGHFGPSSCDDWFDPPTGPQDIAAKVAAKVCTVGGLPVPRKYCDEPAPPK